MDSRVCSIAIAVCMISCCRAQANYTSEFSTATVANTTTPASTTTVTTNRTITSTTTAAVTSVPADVGRVYEGTKTNTSIEVKWEEPPQGSVFDRFEVTWKLASSSTLLGNETVENSQRLKILTGLSPGQSYNITVRTMSNGLFSRGISQGFTIQPNAPRTLKVVNRRETSLDFTWSAPDQTVAVDRYEYTVTKQGGDAGTEDTVTTLTAIHHGLTPGAKYTIRVLAVKAGVKSDETTIEDSTVPADVGRLYEGTNTSTSVLIMWTEPQQGSVFDGFEVTWKVAGSSTQLGKETIEKGLRFKKLTGLTPGQNYRVTVRTMSNGLFSRGIAQDVSTQAPGLAGIVTKDIQTRSIKISWRRPSGAVNGYNLLIGPTDGVVGLSAYLTATNAVQEYTFESLFPGRTYTFDIIVVYPSGRSPAFTQTVTTIPAKARNLNVQIVSATSAKVSWDPAPVSIQDKYQVRYQNSTTHTWSAWEEVLAPTHHKDIDQLFPGLQYRCEVVVQSNHQKSSAVSATGTTYPLPPVSVSVDRSRTTEDSVLVKWEYNAHVNHVTHWKVTYTVQDTSAWKLNSYYPIPLSTTETTLGNLVSGKNYTVCVYSLTDGEVESETCTSTDATIKPKRLESFIEVTERGSTTQIAAKYARPSGSGVFDHYVFSINASTHINKQTVNYGQVRGEIIFSGLTPGSHYQISAMTVSGVEESTQLHVDTVTVPLSPESLECSVKENSINLDIKQPTLGQAESYCVQCLGFNCSFEKRSVRFRNDVTNLTVDGLSSFNNYTFKVTSRLQNKTSEVVTITCQTGQDAPGRVRNVIFTYIKPYQVTVHWEPPGQRNGKIKNYFIDYNGMKKAKDDHDLQETIRVPVTNETRAYMWTITDLQAGYTYTFEIWAETVKFGPKYFKSVITPVTEPKIVLTNDEPKLQTSEWDQFIVDFTNPFDDRNGDVVAVSVIILTGPDEAGSDADITASWVEVHDLESPPPYAAVHKCTDLFTKGDECWSTAVRNQRRRKRAAPGDKVQITVGGDTDCSGSGGYCNGPLQPDTVYRVFIRGYTENGLFADGSTSKPIATAAKPLELTIIIAVVIVSVLLVVATVVIFIILRRKGMIIQCPRRRSKVNDTVKMTEQSATKARSPILLTDFPQHVEEMATANGIRFSAEYEEFKVVGRDQSCDAAEHQANRLKNRFINIFPYDHSRVKLLPTDDDEGSDYINASWMPGYNSKREFIVCQGPLTTTVDDMWRLIWEYNCQAIVMLTKCVEKGKDKCAQYLPLDSEAMFRGDLKVAILSRKETHETCISEIEISQGEVSRRFSHFHYLLWDDFGVLDRPQLLIKFVRMVRGRLRSHAGPVLVHCSAGVGRSGTFITVDRILQHIKDKTSIDIFGIVHELRLFRPLMVQTEKQYVYIHKCLSCVLEGKEHEEDNDAYDDTDSGTSND